MNQRRMVRFVVLAVVSLGLLAWGPAPAQAAPIFSSSGAWSWVSEVWTGLFPSARPVRPPHRPDSGKAGGCVDPDGRTITLCSAVESLPDPSLPTNG